MTVVSPAWGETRYVLQVGSEECSGQRPSARPWDHQHRRYLGLAGKTDSCSPTPVPPNQTRTAAQQPVEQSQAGHSVKLRTTSQRDKCGQRAQTTHTQLPLGRLEKLTCSLSHG